MKDADRHIKARITLISRGRRGDREDLREHILAAAEEHAGDRPIDKRDIEAAFASLGKPAEIRQAFFPRRELKVPAWGIVALVLATLLAALDAFSSQSATCGDGDEGIVRCAVSAGDGLLNSLLSIMPPLVVLAAHFVGPRWIPTALAATWLAVYIVPSTFDTGLARTVGILAAGLITITVAAVIWQREGSE